MKATKVLALTALLGSSSLSYAEISGSGHQIEGCNGAINSFVWHDQNQNGIFDANDRPLPHVKLRLQLADQPELGSDTLETGSDGRVLFFNLCLADHLLWVDEESLPEGMVSTAINLGSEQRDVLGELENNPNDAVSVGLNIAFLEEETVSFGFAHKECTQGAGDRRCGPKDPGSLTDRVTTKDD